MEISLPKTENQLAAIPQSAAMPDEVSHPTKRKHKAPKPPMKKAAAEEKKPKPPAKHTLKEKLELEREEQAAKRRSGLRKLRQAKKQPRGGKDHLTTATAGRGVTKRRSSSMPVPGFELCGLN